MAVLGSERSREIPTYVEDEGGRARVRCRRTTCDSDVTRLIDDCDEWVISTPGLRPGTAVAKSFARRLHALRIQLVNPADDWQGVAKDEFSLTVERLDLMLDHGRDVFLGATQRVDCSGVVRDVALIALAPCSSDACDIVLELRRT